MENNSKILVLGHNGMVGSAILKNLNKKNYSNILVGTERGKRLDLTNQYKTFNFIEKERPDYVFLAAAQVGGIYANENYPAKFIYNNLSIQTNIIEACRIANVKKLLFLGSSCIYPKEAENPIMETSLLTGPLEKTNEYYAIAKIAGIKMCEAYWKEYGCRFISCQPCNLYGINDNYDPMNSHVIPGLIRRIHKAKECKDSEVVIWGSGNALREFLHVDDLAEACVFLMNNYENMELINVGSSIGISIKDLAKIICEVIGFQGNLNFDISKPDGTMKKTMDSSKILNMGWKPKVNFKEGLSESYKDFINNHI